jgi:AraC-like DNA-binding protein
VPDGCVDIIFNLSHARGVCSGVDEPEAAVVGVITRPLRVERPAAAPMLGVTLAPAAARSFLDVPINDLNDKLVDLRALWGRETDDLLDGLRRPSTMLARARQLDAFLARKLAHGRGPDPMVVAAVRLIRAHAGRLSMHDLVEQLGVSERGLQRRFRQCTGLSPKGLSRIARVQAVLLRLARERTVARTRASALSWGGVAWELGFSDQAHLIREFRAMTGVTPGRYLGERGLSDSFNTALAEEITFAS